MRPVTFSPIEAALSARFGNPHCLAVDDPGTRFRIASHLLACPLPERIVDLDEGAVERPRIEVVTHRIPIGKVGGQQPPLAARASQIQESVDHLSEIDDGWPTHVSFPHH